MPCKDVGNNYCRWRQGVISEMELVKAFIFLDISKTMAEVKSMEHSTLKVPYEVLNKKFRVAQKSIDRELDQIQNSSRDIEHFITSSKGIPTVGEVGALVGNVVERIQILKRKAEESLLDELNAGLVCKRKIQHLRVVVPPDSDRGYDAWQASIDQWKRVCKIYVYK